MDVLQAIRLESALGQLFKSDRKLFETLPKIQKERDFGTHQSLCLPLPLHKITESGSVAAQDSPLLAILPPELLSDILSYLPHESLANFALVNSDCRQLARSIQYEHWRFDYRRLDDVIALADESLERFWSQRGNARSHSLGACIRRLTVSRHPDYVAKRHGTQQEILRKVDDKECARLLTAASDFYNAVDSALLFITVLTSPNLELLDWRVQSTPRSKIMEMHLHSSLKHLRWDHLDVDKVDYEEFSALPIIKPSTLETLDLYITPSFDDQDQLMAHNYVVRMLNHCSASLRTLRWRETRCKDAVTAPLPMPQMPNLEELSLLYIDSITTTDIEALIPANPNCQLRQLIFYFPSEPIIEHLAKRGTIGKLNRLSWLSPDNLPLEFLYANPHINLLSIQYQSMQQINLNILPMLASKFRNLKSLEIVHYEDSTTISDSALSCISRMTTLEQLHIEAGYPWGWRHTWVVDHREIRSCIKSLPNLKHLALSRDTYDPEGLQGQWGIEHYYSDARFTPHDPAEFFLRRFRQGEQFEREVWLWKFEMVHRRRMLMEANQYRNLRYNGGPKLEFMYFGQLPIKVKLGWHGWRALAMTDRRDSCYNYLKRTFTGGIEPFDD